MTALRHYIIGNNIHFIKINTPLNGSHAAEVELVLRQLARRGARRIVINLEDVPFIDGRGLAALVNGLKLLGCNADCLQLVSPQAQPRLLFALTGYDRIFQISHHPEAMPLAA